MQLHRGRCSRRARWAPSRSAGPARLAQNTKGLDFWLPGSLALGSTSSVPSLPRSPGRCCGPAAAGADCRQEHEVQEVLKFKMCWYLPYVMVR